MNIEMKAISKAYGGQSVLRELSCAFPEGRISCILGPSGCGKTTLLRLIAGLERSDSGSICGADTLKISAVFQENRLFEGLSAVKNVLLTARRGFDRRDAEAMLRALGLEDSKKRLQDYSGGMQRRVAVARALAADYELLLLDEPLTGLDGGLRRQVRQYILQALGGRSCIWVTHDPEVADFADGTVLRL